MLNPRKNKRFSFTPMFKTIEEILVGQNLATLGDTYTNLVYSLFLSTKMGEPTGAKANSRMLSKALKQAGLRGLLPSRTDRHKQADAAESLLVYVWLQGLTTIKESINIMKRHENATKAFSSLLSDAKKKIDHKC
jgi:hypothetical protein